MSLNASYDVDVAKQYGVAAAAIYNKLVYLSRYTTRDDGFCWRTAEEFKNELGVAEKAQRTAIEKLESAGLIVTKNTYITGTMTKCKHFYITNRDDVFGGKSDFDKTANQKPPKGTNQETDKRANLLSNNQTKNQTNNNQKENIKEKPERKKYGEYKNVLLSFDELAKLQTEFPADWEERIERLSSYKKSTGKKYADDLATIRNWARRDREKKPTATTTADSGNNPFVFGDLPF